MKEMQNDPRSPSQTARLARLSGAALAVAGAIGAGKTAGRFCCLLLPRRIGSCRSCPCITRTNWRRQARRWWVHCGRLCACTAPTRRQVAKNQSGAASRGKQHKYDGKGRSNALSRA